VSDTDKKYVVTCRSHVQNITKVVSVHVYVYAYFDTMVTLTACKNSRGLE